MKYIKSAARLLDQDCVNRKGLDLTKEVLWVTRDQRAAELPAVQVVGQKEKNLLISQSRTASRQS